MEFNEYQKMAMVTKKAHETVKDQIVDALLGLAGEAGEIHEVFKKHFSTGKIIDMDDLEKEIGDVLWYLAELCDAMGLTLDSVAARNIAKLKSRHGDKFSGHGDRTGNGA